MHPFDDRPIPQFGGTDDEISALLRLSVKMIIGGVISPSAENVNIHILPVHCLLHKRFEFLLVLRP